MLNSNHNTVNLSTNSLKYLLLEIILEFYYVLVFKGVFYCII